MAKFLDKTNVKTAVKPFKDFDLSCQHLTTGFFMRPTIVYAAEFPKFNMKCNLQSYARLQPLLRPVMGSVQVHNRAFHVPFRVVWPCWDSFLTAAPFTTPSGTMVINAVPTINNEIIAYVFDPANGYGLSTVKAVLTTPMDNYCDFYLPSSQTNGITACVLTPFGRHCMKILNQLGYKVHFGDLTADTSVEPNTYSVGSLSKDSWSFLPLLCYAKLFLDWMYPAQYAHSGDAAVIDGMMQRNFRYDASAADLMAILNFTAWAYYGNDYFTSNFDTPNAPAVGYDVSMTIPDNGQFYPIESHPASIASNQPIDRAVVTIASDGTPYIAGKRVSSSTGNIYETPTYLTQYLDTALKKLSNWQRRHQLVGARVLDRYLADFETVPTWEKLKRSSFIGSQSFPVQFQDVMSNSDTIQDNAGVVTGAQLGSFAGKGLAFNGKGDFEFSSDEFGFVIIVNIIVPDIAYYEGFNRHVLHKNLLDFINGEFESLGTQPTSAGELYYGFNAGGANGSAVFGFLPRYSEYKCGHDMLTGLFNYDSVNLGMLAWSTARRVNASDRHGIGFLRGDDAWQFARIFYGEVQSPDDELDKFIFVHRINIKVSMQASPMYDVFEFDEEAGNDLLMQVNGAKL